MKPSALPALESPSHEFDIRMSDGSMFFATKVKGGHSIHNLKTQIEGIDETNVDSIRLLCRGKEL